MAGVNRILRFKIIGSDDMNSGARAGGRPAYILIVEDNPGDVFIMQEALREHSIECLVTVLSDGDQASRFFQRIEAESTTSCPDLVLLDLNLPRLSGHEVLTKIRSMSRCASLPIIVVSSSNAEADLTANKRLGATDYFQKPSSLDEFMKLGAKVNSYLG